MLRALTILLLAAIAACLPGQRTVSADARQGPVVAAASDLQFALNEIAAAFTHETGRPLRLSFGSSGNLVRQIRDGAPFEMFLSADEAFVFDLARDGLTVDDGALYAVGRLALFVPHASSLKADGTLEDLRQALAEGRVDRLAIANPEHAPYGRRAEEALRHAGLWEAIRDRLVVGENVSQAAQFAATGGADGGIIAWSLALSPGVAGLGHSALIPEAWHAPLRQRMVLLAGHGETAALFFAFMQEVPARAIMRRYGFALPGETM
jgi:molybdate transport system substrate-binding protein